MLSVATYVAHYCYNQLNRDFAYFCMVSTFHVNFLWMIVHFKAPKFLNYVFMSWFFTSCLVTVLLEFLAKQVHDQLEQALLQKVTLLLLLFTIYTIITRCLTIFSFHQNLLFYTPCFVATVIALNWAFLFSYWGIDLVLAMLILANLLFSYC